MSENHKHHGAYLILGVLVGAIGGLLFAPKAGKETREYLKKAITDSKDMMDKTKESAEELISKTKEQINDMIDNVSNKIDEKVKHRKKGA